MALINCPYCGEQISSLAKECPHCSSVFEEEKSGAAVETAAALTDESTSSLETTPSLSPQQAEQSAATASPPPPSTLEPKNMPPIPPARPMVVERQVEYVPMPQQSSNGSALLIGLLAGLVVVLLGIVIYFFATSGKTERPLADETDTAVATKDYASDASGISKTSLRKKRSKSDKSAAESSESATASESNLKAYNLYATQTHFLSGVMIVKKRQNPIRLEFTTRNGNIIDITYRNVNAGKNIEMECTQATETGMTLFGWSDNDPFYLYLNYRGNGKYEGTAVVGKHQLGVKLKE